jgi:regulator of protease activity HflC (stomatin/prohibitin superfamily)
MNNSDRNVTLGVIAGIVAVFAVICLISSLNHVNQSDVGFSVSKGFLDPNKGKVSGKLLDPGMHVTGIVDDVWTFPAYRTPRYQDFKVSGSTRDGKQVTIDAQYGFRFIGEKNPALAKEFVLGPGSRKYGGDRPGESDEAWQKFLDKMIDPDARGVARDVIGRVYCADFVPSCRAIDPRRDVPDTDPERVYDDIAEALYFKVKKDLGNPYLVDFRIKVNDINLPGEVQHNIDLVTAEQAKTKAAQQSQQTAIADAAAIRTKAAALKQNKELVAVEVAKACGDKCSLILDGTGSLDATVAAGR